MGVYLRSVRKSVRKSWHVEQILAAIHEGGAIRTAGPKVMPFTTQHEGKLICWGDGRLRNRPNIPATSVSLCISTGTAAGSGKPLSSSPHPGGCFTHTSRYPYFPKFLWSLTRPANLSCVPCLPVPFVRVPGIQGLDFPAVSAIQLSVSRDRCFTSPQQGPCPVNLGSMRASGGTWRPYPRRCGAQGDPPMMVATLAQTYTLFTMHLHGFASALSHLLRSPNMMMHCGVRPPMRTAPS